MSMRDVTGPVSPGQLPARRLPLRAAIAAAAAIFATASGAAETPAPAPYAGMAVSVVRARSSCFSDTVRVSGIIMPREESHVRAEIEGARVSQILVETGDTVTAGQVLLRLARPDNQPNLPASMLAVQSPVAGTVGRILTQVGAMVAMAAPPLFTINIGGEMEMQADVPSTRITKVKADQSARVDIAGLSQVAGKVRLVAPEVNAGAQTGQARISLSEGQKLRFGTFARATIEVGTSCGTSIPLSAVLYGPEGPIVQVVRDNRVETRPVPIGLLSGGNVEVRQGLNEGDLVVKRSGSFLREGDRVRPFLEDTGPVRK